MTIRKLHNNIKRSLIQSVASPGKRVLDVGCGRGGDIFKWLDCGVELTCVDPDSSALTEAKRRARAKGAKVEFFKGDVTSAPERAYDIVCYNFSFQYTFASEQKFEDTIEGIVKRTGPGSKLVGVIPDSNFVLSKGSKYTDSIGNYVLRNEDRTGNGDFGETIWVCVKDTAYYEDNEPISEPIAYKDTMIQKLRDVGFKLDEWKPIVSHTTGYITDMYSEFIFTRVE